MQRLTYRRRPRFSSAVALCIALAAMTGMECPTGDGMNNNDNSNNNNVNSNSNANGNTGNPASGLFDATSAMLFGTNIPSVVILKNPADLTGVVKADITINRSIAPSFVEVTQERHLLVIDDSTIDVFTTLEAAESGTPDRSVTGNFSSASAQVDRVRDILYLRSFSNGQGALLAYHDISGDAFDGEVQPDRTMTSDLFSGDPAKLRGTRIDADDHLYIAYKDPDNDEMSILVFDHASTLSGPISPDRIIRLPDFDGFFGGVSWPLTDDQGNLFLEAARQASSSGFKFGFIRLANAASLNGPETFTAALDIADYTPIGSTLSADGVIYTRGAGSRTFYVHENAATLDGDVTADRQFEWSELDDPALDTSVLTTGVVLVE